MSKNRFKTQYKDLPSIEKRLDELCIQESKRSLSSKECDEFLGLRVIARKLRKEENKKPSLLEIRKKKIGKILTGV